MNSQTCDSKRVFEIMRESAYKAILFDNVPEVLLRWVGAIPSISPGLAFTGGFIGYSIRGIARECLSEYTPKIGDYSIAPYLGAFFGGGVKYLIKGYNSLTSSKVSELFDLGAVNALGYEVMTDFKFNTTRSVIASVLLEASEAVTPFIFRSLNGDNIKKNILINAGATLIVSAEIEWLYTPFKKQAEAWYEVINANMPTYQEIKSEAKALCHKAEDYVISLIGSNHTSFDVDKEL